MWLGAQGRDSYSIAELVWCPILQGRQGRHSLETTMKHQAGFITAVPPDVPRWLASR